MADPHDTRARPSTVRRRAWLAAGLVAAGGAGCGRGEVPARDRRAPVVDAGVIAIDAGGVDAPVDGAIDAAAPQNVELALRPGRGDPIYASPKRVTRWRWTPRGVSLEGRTRWIVDPADDDAWHLDLVVTRDGAPVWSCPADDCPLACEPTLHCDVGLVLDRDSLILAVMSMNKLNFMPEHAVRLTWRRGQIAVTELDDPCRHAGARLWPEYCDEP